VPAERLAELGGDDYRGYVYGVVLEKAGFRRVGVNRDFAPGRGEEIEETFREGVRSVRDRLSR